MTDTIPRCWGCNIELTVEQVAVELASCDACYYRYETRCGCDDCTGGGHRMGCRDRRAQVLRAYRAAQSGGAA